MSHEDDGPLTPAPTIRDLGPPIDLAERDTEPPPTEPTLTAVLGKLDALTELTMNLGIVVGALKNIAESARSEARSAHDAANVAADKADEIMGVVSASHRMLKGQITEHLIRIEAAGDKTNSKFGKVADFQGEQISTLFQMQAAHASKPADDAHSVYTNGNGNGVAAEE